VAAAVTRELNRVSRRFGLGSGTVIGGRAGLAVDPQLVARLAAGRPVALVSGTNGKTTTTRLLSVALAGTGPVVSNTTGSNMPAGHAAALAAGPASGPVVLEVDEGYLPAQVAALRPAVVLLLNLSRDQLDRTNEVRMLAGRWRRALAGRETTTVVANADDPLVVWGAGEAPRVLWVAAGLRWRADAVGCPACGGRIEFAEPAGPASGPGADADQPAGGWACDCGFARPRPDAWLESGPHGGAVGVFVDGTRRPLDLALPGTFNRANALMAVTAAGVLGVDPDRALAEVAGVADVAGRFAVARVGGVATRMLLAKNPAGWAELLDLVGPGTGPVVVGINARVADGRDPSWLWDVAFERLAGRPVVATGERCRDLSVRLRYAGVEHQTVPDQVAAVAAAAGLDGGDREGGSPVAAWTVDYVGNYTAFHALRARVDR
jgi:UDP-N-acetylmuramyl tripeptide synthase